MAELPNTEFVKKNQSRIMRDKRMLALNCPKAALQVIAREALEHLQNACNRIIEQLEEEARFITPDQNEMQILKERIAFYGQIESKRNKELEELYSAATKALNSQIEVNSDLQAKIEQQQECIGELAKYIRRSKHLKGCKTSFISDARAGSFYKDCDCGYQQALAKATELLKPKTETLKESQNERET